MYLLVAKLQKRPYCPFLKLTLELYNFYIFHCLKLTTCCCKKTTNVLCNRLHKNCYYKLRDFVSGKTFTWLERLQQITNFLYYLKPLCFLRNNQSLCTTERMEWQIFVTFFFQAAIFFFMIKVWQINKLGKDMSFVDFLTSSSTKSIKHWYHYSLINSLLQVCSIINIPERK